MKSKRNSRVLIAEKLRLVSQNLTGLKYQWVGIGRQLWDLESEEYRIRESHEYPENDEAILRLVFAWSRVIRAQLDDIEEIARMRLKELEEYNATQASRIRDSEEG